MTLTRRATAVLVAAAVALTSALPMSGPASSREARNRGHAAHAGHRIGRRDFSQRRHAGVRRSFAPRRHVAYRSFGRPARHYAHRSRTVYYAAPRRAYRPYYGYAAAPSYYYNDAPYYSSGGYYDDGYYYHRRKRHNIGKAIAIGAGLIALGVIASHRHRRW